MRITKKITVFLATMMMLFGFYNNLAYAKLFTGMAPIENGNIAKAKEDARKDAYRAFAESEVGTRVSASTEMVNYMVVRDRVVADSNAYVLTKGVIEEKSMGDVYKVVLDLEASDRPIEMAIEDVKTQIAKMSDNSSRSGVDIAIYDDDAKRTGDWANYLAETMNMYNYDAQSNDVISDFLGKNINRMNDLEMNSKLRQIGRSEDLRGNSLIRGRVALARKAEPVSGGYRAVASFSAQIIGYENNSVDATTRYAIAVASTPEEAEKDAKEAVVREAVDIIANQTAKTIQREQGRGTIKTTLIFAGITNKGAESQRILQVIGSAGIRVVRNAFSPDGTFKVFVAATDFGNGSELADAVVTKLQGVGYSNAYKEEAQGIGAIKYVVKLRG